MEITNVVKSIKGKFKIINHTGMCDVCEFTDVCDAKSLIDRVHYDTDQSDEEVYELMAECRNSSCTTVIFLPDYRN